MAATKLGVLLNQFWLNINDVAGQEADEELFRKFPDRIVISSTDSPKFQYRYVAILRWIAWK